MTQQKMTQHKSQSPSHPVPDRWPRCKKGGGVTQQGNLPLFLQRADGLGDLNGQYVNRVLLMSPGKNELGRGYFVGKNAIEKVQKMETCRKCILKILITQIKLMMGGVRGRSNRAYETGLLLFFLSEGQE